MCNISKRKPNRLLAFIVWLMLILIFAMHFQRPYMQSPRLVYIPRCAQSGWCWVGVKHWLVGYPNQRNFKNPHLKKTMDRCAPNNRYLNKAHIQHRYLSSLMSWNYTRTASYITKNLLGKNNRILSRIHSEGTQRISGHVGCLLAHHILVWIRTKPTQMWREI